MFSTLFEYLIGSNFPSTCYRTIPMGVRGNNGRNLSFIHFSLLVSLTTFQLIGTLPLTPRLLITPSGISTPDENDVLDFPHIAGGEGENLHNRSDCFSSLLDFLPHFPAKTFLSTLSATKAKKNFGNVLQEGKTRGSPLHFSGVSFFVRRKSERGNSRAQFGKMGTSEISDHTRLKCAMAVSTTGLRLISFSPFFTRSWRRRELSASGACMLFEVTNNRRFGSLHSIPPPSLLESEFHMHVRFHIFRRGLFGGGKMNSLHCSSYAEL